MTPNPNAQMQTRQLTVAPCMDGYSLIFTRMIDGVDHDEAIATFPDKVAAGAAWRSAIAAAAWFRSDEVSV